MAADERAEQVRAFSLEEIGRVEEVRRFNRRRQGRDASGTGAKLSAPPNVRLDHAFLLEAFDLGGVEAEIFAEDLFIVFAEQRRPLDVHWRVLELHRAPGHRELATR